MCNVHYLFKFDCFTDQKIAQFWIDRELDLNAKQVVFMNGNETIVADGISEYSFLYDHSFWSLDKQQGIIRYLHNGWIKVWSFLRCCFRFS